MSKFNEEFIISGDYHPMYPQHVIGAFCQAVGEKKGNRNKVGMQSDVKRYSSPK